MAAGRAESVEEGSVGKMQECCLVVVRSAFLGLILRLVLVEVGRASGRLLSLDERVRAQVEGVGTSRPAEASRMEAASVEQSWRVQGRRQVRVPVQGGATLAGRSS